MYKMISEIAKAKTYYSGLVQKIVELKYAVITIIYQMARKFKNNYIFQSYLCQY